MWWSSSSSSSFSSSLHAHFHITIIVLIHVLSTSISSPLDFPCKPPHFSSYPFCNTSLSPLARSESLISLLTLPEKLSQLTNNASSIPRLGIPPYEWWSECLHGIATNGPGVTFTGGPIPTATSFPQTILAAAAFNRTLWYLMAAAIGVEARAMYNVGQAGLTFWAPNVNVFRDPRWGRGQETPGEDPMTVSSFAVEFVRGFQQGGGYRGRDTDNGVGEMRLLREDDDGGGGGGGLMVSACCKHFTAYDLEKWGSFSRYNFNAVVTAQDMEDTYQPPFRSCIQQGKASCLMCSYNEVNGIPACARKDILQKARDDWGFDGYITSDCDAVATVYEYQHYTKDPEDAVADVLRAGVDINCGTYLLRNTESSIRLGKIKEKDIDRALLNLFTVQFRLGMFDGDPGKRKYGKLGPQDVCTQEHRALALEAARQGIVLLKNTNNFLPLSKSSSTLAVVGPLGNTTKLGGGYSGIPCNPRSIFEELNLYIERASYATGCIDVSCKNDSGFSEAISAAKEAEVVIIVAGLDLTQETEDQDRVSLLLPGKQMDLISSVSAVTKQPVILVLTGGGPLDVSVAEKDPRIASILWIGYPGEVGGKALAEVIFGEYNPGGRLPMTWYPESFTKVPMNDMHMRADPSRGYPGRTYRFYTGDRVYGFGKHMSYTNYTYSLSAPKKISLLRSYKASSRKDRVLKETEALQYVEIDELEYCDSLKFLTEISVMNVGYMSGSHVVLLFSRPPKIDGAPEMQLIGFDRVHTVPNRSTETTILVDPCNHLSFADENGKRIMPLGDHVFMVGELEHYVSIEAY